MNTRLSLPGLVYTVAMGIPAERLSSLHTQVEREKNKFNGLLFFSPNVIVSFITRLHLAPDESGRGCVTCRGDAVIVGSQCGPLRGEDTPEEVTLTMTG